jgi:hypothetical protein
MDAQQFDTVVRALATGITRRGALGLLAGLAGVHVADTVTATRHKPGHRGKGGARKKHRSRARRHQTRDQRQSLRASTHHCTPKVACLRWCLSHSKGKAAGECIAQAAKCKGPCQECGVACGTPCAKTLCGQRCVDLETDSSNCGSCGHACPSGQTCSAAMCGCSGSGCGCPAGQKPCNGACIPTDGCCQDTDCNDNNLCTTDTCDTGTHTCVHDEVDCDDNNACTIDSCDPQVGCVHVDDPNCGGGCSSDAECDDANACTDGRCVDGLCEHNPISCDDGNPCTADSCDQANGCQHTPIDGCCRSSADCNDNIACTVDECVDGRCVHTPQDDLCESSDPCIIPRCTASGCISEPKNCDDGNPCTVDSCIAGQCVNTPGNFCNDGLRCTHDICVPDDETHFHCEFHADLGLCGLLSSCQTAECGFDRDCLITNNDALCPTHPTAPACLLPHCSATGACQYQDICGASHPDCAGCAQCTCNPILNKCVKTCAT